MKEDVKRRKLLEILLIDVIPLQNNEKQTFILLKNEAENKENLVNFIKPLINQLKKKVKDNRMWQLYLYN